MKKKFQTWLAIIMVGLMCLFFLGIITFFLSYVKANQDIKLIDPQAKIETFSLNCLLTFYGVVHQKTASSKTPPTVFYWRLLPFQSFTSSTCDYVKDLPHVRYVSKVRKY